MDSETRQCQNCSKDFVIEPEDFDFYEKIHVPAPTFCPDCRMIRRFHYRNERMLFRRPDAHTGKEIFSGFSVEANVKTVTNDHWIAGDWDQLATGVDYDFKRPFFEQYAQLMSQAPLPARSIYNLVNSDYCNEVSEMKNCYLCFNADYVEDSAYLRKLRRVKNSFDLYECFDTDRSYEGVMIDKGYQNFYSVECESCVDVWFSRGLRGCNNCFGCVNLSKKSYCWFNEQLTREEYTEKFEAFNSGSYQEVIQMLERAHEFWLTFPIKYNHSLRVVNATGDRLYDSRNLKDCYYVREAENLAYCQDIWSKTSSCYDYSVWGDGAENIYECMTCGDGVANLKFCFNCWEGARDMEYCAYCVGSSNCFGCVGLYKKEYCIFNKQYTKEEYFELREKIIKHMNDMPYVDKKGRTYRYGEFFPFEISPTAYNESLAHDFVPLTKDQVEEKGYVWHDIVLRDFEKTVQAQDLQDDIQDASDGILSDIIECTDCQRPFRVIESELQFYKSVPLPLPRKCHDCRFVDRFAFVKPPKFYQRSCMKEGCSNTFSTPYSSDDPNIIYCEEHYQEEVS